MPQELDVCVQADGRPWPFDATLMPVNFGPHGQFLGDSALLSPKVPLHVDGSKCSRSINLTSIPEDAKYIAVVLKSNGILPLCEILRRISFSIYVGDPNEGKHNSVMPLYPN